MLIPINPRTIIAAAKATKYALSKDPDRKSLGLYCLDTTEPLAPVLVATDGRQLAWQSVETYAPCPAGRWTIAPGAIRQLDPRQDRAEIEPADVRYPNWRSAIPASTPHAVELPADCRQWLDAQVKAYKPGPHGDTVQICGCPGLLLYWDADGAARLEARYSTGTETIGAPMQWPALPLPLVVNAAYLSRAIKRAGPEIRYDESTRPCLCFGTPEKGALLMSMYK